MRPHDSDNVDVRTDLDHRYDLPVDVEISFSCDGRMISGTDCKSVGASSGCRSSYFNFKRHLKKRHALPSLSECAALGINVPVATRYGPGTAAEHGVAGSATAPATNTTDGREAMHGLHASSGPSGMQP